MHLELQQQQLSSGGAYSSSHSQYPSAQTGPGSPSRLSYMRSSSDRGINAAAAPEISSATPASNELPPPAAVAAAAAAVQRRSRSMSEANRADRERMYKSEDWTTPTSSSVRRPGLSVLDTLSAGHRSCSGANTPTAGSTSVAKVCSSIADHTPDTHVAYMLVLQTS